MFLIQSWTDYVATSTPPTRTQLGAISTDETCQVLCLAVLTDYSDFADASTLILARFAEDV